MPSSSGKMKKKVGELTAITNEKKYYQQKMNGVKCVVATLHIVPLPSTIIYSKNCLFPLVFSFLKIMKRRNGLVVFHLILHIFSSLAHRFQ